MKDFKKANSDDYSTIVTVNGVRMTEKEFRRRHRGRKKKGKVRMGIRQEALRMKKKPSPGR